MLPGTSRSRYGWTRPAALKAGPKSVGVGDPEGSPKIPVRVAVDVDVDANSGVEINSDVDVNSGVEMNSDVDVNSNVEDDVEVNIGAAISSYISAHFKKQRIHKLTLCIRWWGWRRRRIDRLGSSYWSRTNFSVGTTSNDPIAREGTVTPVSTQYTSDR